MNSYVVDEINAYVAIRDIALAEAEKDPKFGQFGAGSHRERLCRKLPETGAVALRISTLA